MSLPPHHSPQMPRGSGFHLQTDLLRNNLNLMDLANRYNYAQSRASSIEGQSSDEYDDFGPDESYYESGMKRPGTKFQWSPFKRARTNPIPDSDMTWIPDTTPRASRDRSFLTESRNPTFDVRGAPIQLTTFSTTSKSSHSMARSPFQESLRPFIPPQAPQYSGHTPSLLAPKSPSVAWNQSNDRSFQNSSQTFSGPPSPPTAQPRQLISELESVSDFIQAPMRAQSAFQIPPSAQAKRPHSSQLGAVNSGSGTAFGNPSWQSKMSFQPGDERHEGLTPLEWRQKHPFAPIPLRGQNRAFDAAQHAESQKLMAPEVHDSPNILDISHLDISPRVNPISRRQVSKGRLENIRSRNRASITFNKSVATRAANKAAKAEQSRQRDSALKLAQRDQLGREKRLCDDLFEDPDADFNDIQRQARAQAIRDKAAAKEEVNIVKKHQKLAKEECEKRNQQELARQKAERRAEKFTLTAEDRKAEADKAVAKDERRRSMAVFDAMETLVREGRSKLQGTISQTTMEEKEARDLKELAQRQEDVRLMAAKLQGKKKRGHGTSKNTEISTSMQRRQSLVGVLSQHDFEAHATVKGNNHDQYDMFVNDDREEFSSQEQRTARGKVCSICDNYKSLDQFYCARGGQPTKSRNAQKCLQCRTAISSPSVSLQEYEFETKRTDQGISRGDGRPSSVSSTPIPADNVPLESDSRVNLNIVSDTTIGGLWTNAQMKGGNGKQMVAKAAETRKQIAAVSSQKQSMAQIVRQEFHKIQAAQEAKQERERQAVDKQRERDRKALDANTKKLECEVAKLKKEIDKREVKQKTQAEKERNEAEKARAKLEAAEAKKARNAEHEAFMNAPFSGIKLTSQIMTKEQEQREREKIEENSRQYLIDLRNRRNRRRNDFLKMIANTGLDKEDIEKNKVDVFVAKGEKEWENKRKTKHQFNCEDQEKLSQAINTPFHTDNTQSQAQFSKAAEDSITTFKNGPETFTNHEIASPAPSRTFMKAFHRPQSPINYFAIAASKKRVQDLEYESEESEEDPDPEPKTTSSSQHGTDVSEERPFYHNTPGQNELGHDGPYDTDSRDESLKFNDCDTQTTKRFADLSPDVIDGQHDCRSDGGIPTNMSQGRASRQKFQETPWEDADKINRGKTNADMVHIYLVVLDQLRRNSSPTSVIVSQFKDRDDANRFAAQEIHKHRFGDNLPLIGRLERMDPKDGLFEGEVTLSSDGEDMDKVYVTQVIKFAGDLANFSRRELVTIVPKKIFTITKQLIEKNIILSTEVVQVASTRTVANKAVFDVFDHAVSVQIGSRQDNVVEYQGTVRPGVQERHKDADSADENLEIEAGEDGNLVIKVFASGPYEVQGPLN